MAKNVRVQLINEFDDEGREAVRRTFGRSGKATNTEIRIWMQMVVNYALEELVRDQKAQSAQSFS